MENEKVISIFYYICYVYNILFTWTTFEWNVYEKV